MPEIPFRILLFLFLHFLCFQALAQQVNLGAGYYNLSIPPGGSVPSTSSGSTAIPKVTAAFNQSPQTNDWWTSLIYNYYENTTFNWEMHSWKLYPHPMSFVATRYGLKVYYPTTLTMTNDYGVTNGTYRYNMEIEDFTVGVDGLDLSTTIPVKTDSYGDWHVTAEWNDGAGKVLKATIGHGFPFAYFEKTGGDLYVRFLFGHTIDNTIGTNIIGITHNGHHYGLFAPSGSTWNTSGSYTHDENQFVSGSANLVPRTAFISSLNGQDYFSIALLPDNTLSTLQDFANHAFAFISDTQVSWSYNESSAQLTSTYAATIDSKEGGQSQTMMALYPHQANHSSNVNTSYTYQSARGTMKVVDGNSFSTNMTNYGIIPVLPNTLSAAQYTNINNYLNDEKDATSIFVLGDDTYWTGKRFSRQADLVWLADQMGNTTARDQFLNDLKTELEDWFKADNGESSRGYFYYNDTWDTVIGYDASFGSDLRITDHHFHYGYFIKAVATIGAFDQSWVNDSNWGQMAKFLIRDVANWDRSDTMFPFLRCFDPYAGHSWANGHGNSHFGNDQESSSESLNFAASVYLFGLVTNNTTLRDLGIYLYLTEVDAVQEYWWDVDNVTMPGSYPFNSATFVWGNGAQRASGSQSFELEPEYWLGINALTADGPSLYMGWNTTLTQNLYTEMTTQNGGVEDDLWEDLMWAFQALYDPASALSKYQSHTSSSAYNTNLPFVPSVSGIYNSLSGDQIPPAQLYHWLNNLNNLGQVDATVTANWPAAVAFNDAGNKQYAAYNPPTGSSKTVTFSDGTSFSVPSGTTTLFPAALPLELVYFNAQLESNNIVSIEWKSLFEEQVKAYKIERSKDLNQFEEIAYLDRGFQQEGVYSFEDLSPVEGKNYYRLKILFEDGNFEYSKIELVEINDVNNLIFYPSPIQAGQQLNILSSEFFPQNATIELMDLNGKILFQQELSNPNYSINLPSTIPKSVYFLKCSNFPIQKIVVY